MGRLFGTDGVRGVANEELTVEIAMSIGKALGRILRDDGKISRVAVGYDTRESSEMLLCAITAGLCSEGSDVTVLGMTSTPAVAYFCTEYKFDAAVMLSASHNPSEYNGIKIFSSNGYKLPDALEEKIETLIADKTQPTLPQRVGRCYNLEGTDDLYVEYIKSTEIQTFEGLKVGLDCANGSASNTAKRIFNELGATVYTINDAPNGKNINFKCGSTNMDALKALVKERKLDVGFAFDGDADRCLCVDEKGELVNGDNILAMCALDMKNRGKLKNNTVVGTVMTNFGFTRFCKDNGINFIATKVGDRYVLEEMLMGDFVLGGEQSGHIIFSDYATTGDGQLTAVQVLSLMKRSDKPLSALKSVMTRSPQVLINVTVSAEGKLSFYTDSEIQSVIAEAEMLLGDEGRVVVRPSGTEPLIRVMTEGSDIIAINKIAENIANVIKNKLN